MRFITSALLFAATALAIPHHQLHLIAKRACPSGDTPAAFLSNPIFSSTATNATTPPTYINTFTNYHASSNANGYGGFISLNTYDVAKCAQECSSRTNCASFNIFYERAPSTSYNTTCAVANIKCTFWSGAVTPQNAVNTGSSANNFTIVIAGSNGYINANIAPATGYSAPVFFNNAAISAPLDCNSRDTYLGFRVFDGAFNASRCADACTAQTAYNLAHPPSNGVAQQCRFFNTYVLSKNGVSQGQYCVLYSQTWGQVVAGNKGYKSGNDVFTIGSSYGYANATDAGVCVKA